MECFNEYGGLMRALQGFFQQPLFCPYRLKPSHIRATLSAKEMHGWGGENLARVLRSLFSFELVGGVSGLL